MSNKPKEYHVTVDGYVCTGNFAPAEYLGAYTASSPRAACRKALKDNGYDMSYWDSSRCTWWGCKVTAEEVQQDGSYKIERYRELIRCKDCKYNNDGECIIKAGWFPVKPDWFCADGKRK